MIQTMDRASSRKPWRGNWGPLADGRSRLARLSRTILQELVAEYNPSTPLQRRRVERAAELMAMAEQTAKTIGSDPKSTRRSLTALTKSAESLLIQIQRSQAGTRKQPRLSDLLMREDHEETT